MSARLDTKSPRNEAGLTACPTGASGFIAAHILRILLDRGHSVVASVRSKAKADQIRRGYPEVPAPRLDFVIVEDFLGEHAFKDALTATPPFEAVIHTASPFSLQPGDINRDVLGPAVLGTTRLLEAVQAYAPSVRRVVITSSFFAASKPVESTYLYSDADWNSLTDEQIQSNPIFAYMGSKIASEKAAWDFVAKQDPDFTLTTILPVVVFGPLIHDVASLDEINVSASLVSDFLKGKHKNEIGESQISRWVDVRDSALAHVRAIEVDEAGGKRFFTFGGTFSNREVATILWKHFPALRDQLPGPEVKSGGYPAEGVSKCDTEPSRKILGVEYTSLEDSIVSMAGSLIGLYKP
ncbi:hypothetical protein ACHAP5_001990 [Fusarium lateritium]